MLKEPLLLRQNQLHPQPLHINPLSHAQPRTEPTLADRSGRLLSTLRRTKQPTATAHQPTQPRTSTHSHCTPTHRPTHIHPQPLHINPPSHAHPRTNHRARASQPLGALPPCNAPLQTCLAAARHSASLQCSPTNAPRSRSALYHPAMLPTAAPPPVGAE